MMALDNFHCKNSFTAQTSSPAPTIHPVTHIIPTIFPSQPTMQRVRDGLHPGLFLLQASRIVWLVEGLSDCCCVAGWICPGTSTIISGYLCTSHRTDLFNNTSHRPSIGWSCPCSCTSGCYVRMEYSSSDKHLPSGGDKTKPLCHSHPHLTLTPPQSTAIATLRWSLVDGLSPGNSTARGLGLSVGP